jgi:hypothetical protein
MSMKKNITNSLKKTFIGLVFIFGNYAFATSYYVDATGGSDSHRGTSETQAWKTLNKVNASHFSPGDKILFKRGNTWYGRLKITDSGSSGAPITFGAYGTGDKPIIRDVFQQTLSWSNQGSNIWKAAARSKINRLWENGRELHRANHRNMSLDIGPKFRFMWKDGYIYLYHTGTPSSSAYSFMKHGSAISFNDQSYIIVENINAQGGENCISGRNAKYSIIRNCIIGNGSYIGVYLSGSSEGSSHHNRVTNNIIDANFHFNDEGAHRGIGSDARGCSDGVYITHYGHDMEIDNNILKDWGHSHVMIYPNPSKHENIYNINFHHNYISSENTAYGKAFDILGNTHHSTFAYNHLYKVTGGSDINGHDNHVHHNLIEYTKHYGVRGGESNGNAINMNNGAGSVYNNIIEKNIIAYSDSEGITVNAYSSNGTVHDIIIRNNILYKNGKNHLTNEDSSSLAVWNTNHMSDITIEDNLIVHADVAPAMIRYNRKKLTSVSAFNNVTEVAGDRIENNIESDPKFVSATDYTLQSGSPAASYGIDVSLIGPAGGVAPSTPAAEPTTPAAEPTTPAAEPTGAFIMDRSGLR